ncbi:glycosyltransferase family 4 protein [soil metagenome]
MRRACHRPQPPTASVTAAQPPSSSPRLARPAGIGSPFPDWVWRELQDLARLDPRLYEQLDVYEYSFRPLEDAAARLTETYARLESVLAPAPLAVFLFSGLKRGGAEFVGANLVREAQAAYGAENVLVLVLDWPVTEARDWLADDTRLCTLMLDAPELSREDRKAFVLHYLAGVRPLIVMNCNSGIGWDVYREHGAALKAHTRLGAFAFCFDYTDAGLAVGYPASHLPEALPHLDVVISDHEGFAGRFDALFAPPPEQLERIHPLYQPIEFIGPPTDARRERKARPTVAWASRICRQKRPELVIEIAKLRPVYDFVVYGDLYEPEVYAQERFVAANLRYGGSFRTLRDLPTETFDAFLYTALYDGLPNIVLAAGAAGVPVVTASIGGLPEVIDDATGWPVPGDAPAEAYAEALDLLFADPQGGFDRAQALYARLQARHTQEAYRERIAQLRLFSPKDGGG